MLLCGYSYMSPYTPVFISFVIPYYNAERGVMDIYNSITQNLDGFFLNYEVIIIDDYSNKIIDEEEMHTINGKNNLVYRRLERNKGQSYTTGYGIAKAKGDIIITLDDDLIYETAFILPMVKFYVNNDFDVLYCIRNTNAQHSFARRSIVDFIKWLIFIFSKKRVSSIRLLNDKVQKQISVCIEQPFFSIDKVIYKNQNIVGNIRVKVKSIGKTRYNFIKLVSVLKQYIGFKVNI